MVPKVLEEISYTVIGLLFLSACGSLYLIGYWEVFDVDISNLIGATDIPKSFFFSFVRTWESLAFAFVTGAAILFWSIKDKDREAFEYEKKRNNIHLICLGALIAIILILAGVYHDDFCKTEYLYWMFTGNALSITTSWFVFKTGLFKNILRYKVIRAYLILLIISTPILAYAVGKVKAIDILNNLEFKYILVNPKNINDTTSIKDSTQFKLLGFLGDKIIISTLNNKKILVLNQSAYNTTEFEDSSQYKKKVPQPIK